MAKLAMWTYRFLQSELQEALRFHFEGIGQDGQTIPPPSVMVDHFDVA